MASPRDLAIKFVTNIYRGISVDEFFSLDTDVLKEIFDKHIPVHSHIEKSVEDRQFPFRLYLTKFRALYWSTECYFLLFVRLNSMMMVKELVTCKQVDNFHIAASLAIVYGHVEIFRYLYRRIPRSKLTMCEFAQTAKDHGNKKILDMMISYGADLS